VCSGRRFASIDEFCEYAASIGIAHAGLLTDEPRLLRSIVGGAAGIDRVACERFHRMYDDGVAELSAALRGGIVDGYIRPDIDVAATADTIVAVPFGIALCFGQKPDRATLIAETKATAELMCRGIATE
jgi:hypothetical protein